MANDLGFYDPMFYANEGLTILTKRLGMANTVFRGYDPTPQQRGSIINIKGPGKFVATQVNPSTGGTTQELDPRQVQIKLDQWWEVKFALTDQELTYTKEQIITDHIAPAAYALADAIDRDIASLIKQIPWYANWSSTVTVEDVLKPRQVMFDNKVPTGTGQDIFFMLDGENERKLLALEAFSQYQGAGDTGTATQIEGYLGRRFGMNFFANQNTPELTSGTATGLTAAIDNASGYSKGATTIHVDGLTESDTFKAGDVLQITGDEQLYSITKDLTVSGTESDIEIFPPLAQDVVDDAVVTLKLPAGSGATKTQCFAYHRNCLALAMAPLSDLGNGRGAEIGVATDPVTGLALRSRIWYDADHSTYKVGLDALWGKTVLDANLGCRCI